ncbi:MAG: M20/M25/M40 family metallo-hydrolase [Bryobacteraceae bacterium]|nr:M20/M25/M40 family metallo-hydrolase [Bryobacteraceae bacterium]MDW8378703.1 M20/M25/M40 family metallo-hydrolase [Bryobacterales bacterium]
MLRLFTLAAVFAVPALAPAQEIRGSRIRAHVKFLASDLLEGRGVGARGGELAAEYLAAQLALAGLQPAGENGSYFQRVPLVGVQPLETSELEADVANFKVRFRWLTDFVGYTLQQTEQASLDAEAVFVGHGISAPEFGWDDYKGVDVRGKVVVLFTGEPPSQDPAFFAGKALTYYGRWTYKYEEAARRGATAAIIVHTTPTASYGWDVVKTSWGREDMQVRLEAGQSALTFAGWITEAMGDRIFSAVGKTAAEMLQAAGNRGFEAIPLGVRFRGRFPAKIRMVESQNVLGASPGSDPRKKDEAVVFTAHWDHLGVNRSLAPDGIFNGAVDNATGCAMVLEIARAWQTLEVKPRRSAIFLFVTAEENGLRGAHYYAAHPAVPAHKTALNLNFDAFFPYGRTTDVVVNGAERTTVWTTVQNVAQRFGLTLAPDPRPESGSYYRSDHFAFARAGIPAFSISMGTSFAGKPADWGLNLIREYTAKHYHQPSDEYQESWDFSGLEELAKFGFTIGLDVANSEKMPTWRPGDEFLPARQKSGVR